MPGWRLVIGLGNPGDNYADTRHNAGFMVVDRLMERRTGGEDSCLRSFKIEWNESDAMAWAVVDADDRRSRRAVVKPSTFMNRSGIAVAEALDRFVGATLDDVLVVVDDLSLPLGAIRLRARGSDGGHNGLKSIAAVTGRNDFARLRVGIGQPPKESPTDAATGAATGAPTGGRVPGAVRSQVDFVLGSFTEDEGAVLGPGLERAVQAAEAWLRAEPLERIMSEANQRSSAPRGDHRGGHR